MAKRGLKNKISFAEAKQMVLDAASETEEEEIKFSEALSRVLSRDVISAMNNPPFDRAMMDGYALNARDTEGASSSNPVELKLVGGVPIGEFPAMTVKSGEIVKIMTGAPVPKGADAVLRVEDSKKRDDSVELFESIPAGKDISVLGDDVKVGELILKKGRVLKPHDLGVLAATGNLNVWVKKKPRAMIVSTGSELIEPGGKLRPGAIYDINTYTLSSLVTELGGLSIPEKIIKDDEMALENLLNLEWDVLIISGATSVGEKDFVPEVIKKNGQVLFHGVKIRPGSPVGFGIVNGKPVFMLPGFPVSSIAAFEHFVVPFIQWMLGTNISTRHNRVKGKLLKPIPSQIGRVDFVRVMVKPSRDETTVTPITSKGSSLITTLSKSDGYLLVAEEIESLEAGEQVIVYLY